MSEPKSIRFQVEDGLPISYCRSCSAPIIWRRHPETKKLMPMDVGTATREPDGSWQMESHFAHCPHASKWRVGGQGPTKKAP